MRPVVPSSEPGQEPTGVEELQVAEKFLFNESQQKWVKVSAIACGPTSQQIAVDTQSAVTDIEPSLVIHLKRGGCVKIWKNVISEELLENIKEEMQSRVKYRQCKLNKNEQDNRYFMSSFSPMQHISCSDQTKFNLV